MYFVFESELCVGKWSFIPIGSNYFIWGIGDKRGRTSSHCELCMWMYLFIMIARRILSSIKHVFSFCIMLSSPEVCCVLTKLNYNVALKFRWNGKNLVDFKLDWSTTIVSIHHWLRLSATVVVILLALIFEKRQHIECRVWQLLFCWIILIFALCEAVNIPNPTAYLYKLIP